jgi:oligosaccharide repeat unit polymerase
MVHELEKPVAPTWWMAPYAGAIALMPPLLTAAWLAPVEFHRELGRMAKYMDFGLYTLALTGVFSFAFGAFLAAHTRPATSTLAITHVATSPAICRLLKAVTWLLFALAVAAYAIWFTPLLRDPSILLDVFAGRWSERDIRDTIGTIPGVTTLVQAQIPYVTLLALRWVYIPKACPSRLEKLALVGILLLTSLRNIVWGERIAMIETLVPLAIVFLRQPRRPLLTALAPVFAVVGLFLFFAVFEYFRSWSAYYRFQYDSYWIFVLSRLSGYYITALDNGAGMIHGWSNFAALNTAEWFWRFPWEIGQTLLAKALGLDLVSDDSWLYWNASAEFNNASGIFMPFIDYGKTGGIVFWFLFGLLTGMIYRGFVAGSFAAMLIYPSWFVGVLEMPRILYFSEARYFPVIAICLILTFVIRSLASQETRTAPRRRLL